MITKLDATFFLVVTGYSGSGKSSLVNCGLCPALHRGLMTTAGSAWKVVRFRPGNDPIYALAQALHETGFGAPGHAAEDIEITLRNHSLGLIQVIRQANRDPAENVLVLVDQFEELFRYHTAADDQNDAPGFVRLLLNAKQGRIQTGQVYVVLTMRSDFLGDCAQFPGLPEAISDGLYLIPRMTRDEQREAIEGPLAVVEAEITEDLRIRLVNDIGDNLDQLSILQHALNRTWAHWKKEEVDGPIDLPHYKAIGTMAHALDKHAEKAYGELKTDEERTICEKIFRALTQLKDSRGIRRPTRLSTLCTLAAASEATVINVIEVFRAPSRSFLMPPAPQPLHADTIIDISHESLMRIWERLKEWVNQETGSARMYGRLAEAAILHEAKQGSLWKNPELQLTLDWKDKNHPTKIWAARHDPAQAAPRFDKAMAFLEKSRVAERRALWMKVGAALLILLVAFSGLAYIAITQKKNADTQETLRVAADTSAAQAKRAHIRAEILRGIAEDSTLAAQIQRQRADTLRQIAEQNEARALASEKEALFQKGIAEGNEARADSNAAEADSLRRIAQDQARIADARRLASQSQSLRLIDNRFDLSLLLSQEALDKDSVNVEAQNALLAGLLHNPQLNTFLHAHQKGVSSLAFSHQYLASGSADNTIVLWDPDTKQPLHTLRGHQAPVESIAFSADGQRLASGSAGGTIIVWDPDTGQPLDTLQNPQSAVKTVIFSPDGKQVAFSSFDDTIFMWTFGTERPLFAIRGPISVRSAAFHPDGTRLAAGRANGSIILWNPDTGMSQEMPQFHQSVVQSVTFSPDGRLLASGSADDTVVLWLLNPMRRLAVLRSHQNDVTSVAFSPKGRYLASGSVDKTVIVWDLDTEQPLDMLRGHQTAVTSVAFSPDGKQLVSSSADSTIIAWDIDVRAPLGSSLIGHRDDVSSVAFSPNGRLLASGSADNTIIVWDLDTEQPLDTLRGHQDQVESVAFSSDGRSLASGSIDKTVIMWNLDTMQLQDSLTEHTNFVLSVAFSPDGRFLASGSADSTIILRDYGVSKLPQVTPLTGHRGGVSSLAFSPDSKRLASGSFDRTIIVWNLHEREPPNTLRGHQDQVESVAFSPDGKRLVSSSADGTIIVWNLDTGQPMWPPFTDHTDAVSSVAFSPDGKRLVSGSFDGNVIVWNLDNQQPMWLPLTGHRDGVRSVAFSPDGKQVASGSVDHTIFLWNFNPGSWADRACRIANRNLTQGDEWKTYISQDSTYRCLCPNLPPCK